MNRISENTIHVTIEVKVLQHIMSEINEAVTLVNEIAEQLIIYLH